VGAGILVAQSAAKTVKRVTQELGGKSANIILEDADLETAVPAGVKRCCMNTGQSCQAPTRMLVHRSQREAVIDLARAAASDFKIGDPLDPATNLGPLANKLQFEKVQRMIEKGIDEGATLVAGGPGRPAGVNRGFFARPTVFADVDPGMTIAREEIFGPVLSIIPYDTEDEAVAIANGTPYGLAAYVQGTDKHRLRRMAERLQAGRVYAGTYRSAESDDLRTPFGGYKHSGNGRERGIFGLEEVLEVKALFGVDPVPT
jgi:aldehyde dehydrogenase (NAD+)